jgi:hypothetical protein
MATPPIDTFARFTRFLEHLADGKLDERLNSELEDMGRALVREAKDSGMEAKGKLVLQLDFSCEPNAEVSVDYKLKATQPRPPSVSSTVWLTGKGAFCPDKPSQPRLPHTERGGRIRVVEDDDRSDDDRPNKH